MPICIRVLALYLPSSNKFIGIDKRKPITKIENSKRIINSTSLSFINSECFMSDNVVIYQRESRTLPLKIKVLLVRLSIYPLRIAKCSLLKYSLRNQNIFLYQLAPANWVEMIEYLADEKVKNEVILDGFQVL